MDSMRSLNTSLPSTTSPKKHNQPPEQLLQAFRAAALSVTNLYKTAASDQAAAHEAGYQDAVEDLIAFLDKENLGSGSTDGSRIRQWATERLAGSAPPQNNSESDEETEVEKRARSSSPVLERKSVQETQQTPTAPTPIERHDSAPPVSPDETSRSIPSGEFTFRSSHPFPSTNDVDMETTDNSQSSTTQVPAMRLEIHPRGSRNPPRHGSRNRNANSANLGHGAGMKRRHQLEEFFDIGNFGNGKDRFGGGGKKGRFS
ncbi:hypothetical protein EJ05DRAFT_475803 [Pseudovirgaria hyperparasitica]|uniref:Uncharacterized protein n=1 Tax=Pseudovirgaria hyperparasitica TaxID=470096 RepID=A0A6A6W6F8_9PEZI|nr:uncharacterized protein EJ05DRAFT_475803 [Pseudovirgaria hyperparasitica]KAF2758498.1 hypothetical protein EJ05DRAFT_475803 [Pseudovirgaria hyperparasitica]